MSLTNDIWMAFEVPVHTRRGPANPNRTSIQVFCDYASAGSLFLTSNPFRTWLPQPLDLEAAYYPDVWKLAYGNVRPVMPPYEQVGP
jgi:hypothetical protein